jgi:hypothetical protein
MLQLHPGELTGVALRQDPVTVALRSPARYSQSGWQLDVASLESIIGM